MNDKVPSGTEFLKPLGSVVKQACLHSEHSARCSFTRFSVSCSTIFSAYNGSRSRIIAHGIFMIIPPSFLWASPGLCSKQRMPSSLICRRVRQYPGSWAGLKSVKWILPDMVHPTLRLKPWFFDFSKNKPGGFLTNIIHICLDGSQLWQSTKSLGFGVPIMTGRIG